MENFLREQFEPLQYAAFFGALVLFGLAESLLPQRPWQKGRVWRWPANFGLTLLNIFVMSAVPVSGLAVADWAAADGIGIMNIYLGAGVMTVAIGVLARSLTNYCVHVAMHKFPPLWRLHRVHHSDAELDVSTAVRFHPLEFAVQVPVSLAVILGLGIPPLAIIAYELLDSFMAVFTHANFRLPRQLERIVGWLFVTPSMHRIHHSSEWHETDSNYGATLSLWDRLFGTLRGKSYDEHGLVQLGLKECQDGRNRSFLWLLGLPFFRRLAPSAVERQS